MTVCPGVKMCLIKSSNILMHTDNAFHYLGMNAFICWVCWIFKLIPELHYTLRMKRRMVFNLLPITRNGDRPVFLAHRTSTTSKNCD